MYWLLTIAVSAWVLADCWKRDQRPTARASWTVWSFVLWPVVLPVYLAKRRLKVGEVREGGTAWNVLKYFALSWTVLMAILAVQGLVALGKQPTDTSGLAAVGAVLGLGVVGAIWFFPVLGALVLGLLLKRSQPEVGPAEQGREVETVARACAACGTAASEDAKFCVQCGSPTFTAALANATEPVSTRDGWAAPPRWLIPGVIGLVVLAVFLFALASVTRRPPTTAEVSKSVVTPPAPPEPGAQWEYRQGGDPMGQGASYSASVQSTNTVSFDFPYSGPQHATLTLRTHPRHGKDVILRIERGQFLCRSYDGCNVLVRFDDSEAQTYSANGPADQSTEVLFIENYPRFVAGMLKASRVRISAEVYQEGVPVFEFDVSGFDVAKYRPTL